MESMYRRFDNDLMRVVIWANQASATQFAQIAPLVIEHVKQETPLALTLIKRAAAEVDRLGSALATQSETSPSRAACSAGWRGLSNHG
jgi:N-acetylglucosamine kinase-like BadF-type ATPase